MSDKKFSILLVDDEAEIRELMQQNLESSELSAQVVVATDGADALRKINVQKFNLVITDIKMPKMDGHELIASLDNVPKDYKPDHVMVASGYVDPEDLEPQMSVIKKPFKLQEFIQYVEMILNAKKPKKAKKKPKKNKINVEFVNPFIEATLEVLDVMCSTQAEKDFLFVKDVNESFGDISGVIPIQSERYIGSMAITFTEEVYLKIVGNMLGEEFTEINEDNRDAVAELCNQVFGNAKGVLAKDGYKLDMTLPSIITGKDHIVSHAVDVSQVLAVYFKTDFGSFVIEVVLTNRA